MNELRDIAFRDPRAAEAYDRREIRKYSYLTQAGLRPEERGLLYRLDRGQISAPDAVRQLDRDETEFVRNYRGRGNPLQDPFFERHRRLGFAMTVLLPEQSFAQAATASARSIVDGPDLLNRYDGEMRAKFLLRQAPSSELRAVSRYLSENMGALDQVFWTNPPPAQMPPLLREIRDLLRHPADNAGDDLGKTALQMTSYVSFVLTLQGATSIRRDSIDQCRTEFRLTEASSCSLRADLRLAAESPDEFDNAHMRHQLSEHLGRFYANYLSLSPADRVSQQGLLVEGELGSALMGGQFGPAFTSAAIQPILDDVRSQLGRTHIPDARGIPLTWSEITGIRESPIEVRVNELPQDIQDLAGHINITVPRPQGQAPWQGTLLDYLSQNVDVIVLTRRAPYLSDDIGEPEATANRLFKTVIIDIDGPQSTEPGNSDKQAFEILSTLAHEAYHNDYFHNLVPYDTHLARATTLNERNAHLFEANVLRQIFQIDLTEVRPLIEQARGGREARAMMSESDLRRLVQFNQEFERLPQLYASHRLIGFAANVPLDYRLTDDQLWAQIFPNISMGPLGRYPTVFVADYLRMTHQTQEQFMNRVQADLFHSLGLVRPSPGTQSSPAPQGADAGDSGDGN